MSKTPLLIILQRWYLTNARQDTQEHRMRDVIQRAMDRSDPEIVEEYIKAVIKEKQKKSYEFPDEVLALCDPEDLKEYDKSLDEANAPIFEPKIPVTKTYNLRRKAMGDPRLVAEDHSYDDSHHSRLVAEDHDYAGGTQGDDGPTPPKRSRLDAEDEAMEEDDTN